VESAAPATSGRRGGGAAAASVSKLESIDMSSHNRISSGLTEVDEVLGGGIVPGGVMLLSGDPGVGKSTLVLQIAAAVAQDHNVLYVSGEESDRQLKMRAERLGVGAANLSILAETNTDIVAATIAKGKYDLVIIDSIQTMYIDALTGAAGSVGQVTASSQMLESVAKKNSVAMMIIGHVTKDGSIAGPKILEHLVDVVLYLEGDKYGAFKALRGIKNRYGSTNEVGIFEMVNEGLRPVSNPSEALLAERQESPGSAVLATMEGTRPLLVEVQALVSTTAFGYPKRTAAGFDLNRLNLLVAVLQKRGGLNLSNQDIYVNIVGGLKINEPAADVAVILAIASAFKDKALPKGLVCFGEVGLSGEIRSVPHAQRRVAEAAKLGFTKAFGPARGAQKELKGLRNVSDALKIVS
jgi:DNA repair protein RadA/Sms